MNVLFFVISFLIMLSFLGYARLDTFRSFLGTQAEFEHYMSSMERSYINEQAKCWYASTYAKNRGTSSPASTPKPDSDNKTKPPAPPNTPLNPANSNSSPRISFRFFVDEELQKSNLEGYMQTLQWAKNLMSLLYGRQEFFKEAEALHASLLDDILEGLERAAALLPKAQKPKHAGDLSTLALSPSLENAFYLMLKGCPREEEPLKIAPQSIPSLILEDGNSDDESDDAEEAQECTIKKGYDSLLNYITLKNTTKIKVFLAPKPVLQAVFGNNSIPDSIIQTRYELYRAVVNRSMTAADATAQFKATYQGFMGGNDDLYLDFKVTKTNPSDYN